MNNTIQSNLAKWDRDYDWPSDGDEWDGQARRCNQPYDLWKRSLIETFLAPHLNAEAVVVEIAPGHGRWSRELAGRCGKLVLIDLSPKCVEFCRQRFAAAPHVSCLVNDGRSLPGVADGSVDMVWSYDAFVHMDAATVAAYCAEFRRVLRPGGHAILHHAGRVHGTLWLAWLCRLGRRGRGAYRILSMGREPDGDGWRSAMSLERFARIAARRGLTVVNQARRWGERGEFGVPRYGDCITTLRQAG